MKIIHFDQKTFLRVNNWLSYINNSRKIVKNAKYSFRSYEAIKLSKSYVLKRRKVFIHVTSILPYFPTQLTPPRGPKGSNDIFRETYDPWGSAPRKILTILVDFQSRKFKIF